MYADENGYRKAEFSANSDLGADWSESVVSDMVGDKVLPNSRKEALNTDLLDERNIARYRNEVDGAFN